MLNIVDLMKGLADPTRLRIINLLYEQKELCVCDLTTALNISQTKASRHLGILRKAGAVTDRKHAQWVYYALPEDLRERVYNSLVQNLLRQEELFISDLKNLELWLAHKNISC